MIELIGVVGKVEPSPIAEIDVTSDPLFTFMSISLDVNQDVTGTKWRTIRIVNATGSLRYAKLPSGKASTEFVFQASNAASETF